MAYASIVPTPVCTPEPLAALVFSIGSHAQARWRRGTNALRRQILPTSLPGINHTGSGSRYSGTDLSGGINRNAHLWAERNRTCGNTDSRPPDRRPFVHRQRRRLTPKCSVNWILRAISTVDALIALQGVDDPTERKKRALVKGRNALDVLDTLKLGLLDGSVDQSTLARLKVASEGLTERSGIPGWIRCWARSTCALRWNWQRQGSARPRAKFRKSESPEVIELSSKSGLPKGPTRILSAAWRAYISLPRVGSDYAPKNKK